MNFKGIKTLVMMQLKDKLDLSFLSSARGVIFKLVLSLLGLALITAVFYVAFMLSVTLSVFSFSSYLPDTVLTAIFTVIQILAILSCTVGLTKALYTSPDNKVLFTLPVDTNEVYFSKLLLYFIFELKRNFSITLPIFIAYGMINRAVFYYYLWAIFCFVIISAIPVVIGAVLSIPGLYLSKIVKRSKVLQGVLGTICFLVVAFLILDLVNRIPENINIMGSWGSITASIKAFLDGFCNLFTPFYMLCKMVVGGTLLISSRLFTFNTFIYLGLAILVIAVMFFASFFLARPLFFKMVSSQFEYEKLILKPKKNKVHSASLSPFFETLKMTMRSSTEVFSLAVQFLAPPIAVFLLNKIYGAMNTSFIGQSMTRAFSLLVMLATALTFNADYANVYSKEGIARNLIKTRPEKPIKTVCSRISVRIMVGNLSVICATVLYGVATHMGFGQGLLITLVGVFLLNAHLLWTAELDIMNPQTDQFATVGQSFSNPNEIKSTVIAFVIALIFAFLTYFLSDTGALSALIKITVLAAGFFAFRAFLFIQRVKLYFAEK